MREFYGETPVGNHSATVVVMLVDFMGCFWGSSLTYRDN